MVAVEVRKKPTGAAIGHLEQTHRNTFSEGPTSRLLLRIAVGRFLQLPRFSALGGAALNQAECFAIAQGKKGCLPGENAMIAYSKARAFPPLPITLRTNYIWGIPHARVDEPYIMGPPMAAIWYFQVQGQEHGPVTAEELQSLADQQQIAADTLIRKGIDCPWVAANKVRGLIFVEASAFTPPRVPPVIHSAGVVAAPPPRKPTPPPRRSTISTPQTFTEEMLQHDRIAATAGRAKEHAADHYWTGGRIAFAVVLCCLVLVLPYSFVTFLDSNYLGPNNRSRETSVESDSTEGFSLDISEPEVELSSSSVRTIPGLAAVDVYGNLTSRGFSKRGPTVHSENVVSWECTSNTASASYQVEIWGRSASAIYCVEASCVIYDGKINSDAKDFLGFVASIPYSGASPYSAKSWAQSNAGGIAETSFGGVRYELFGSGAGACILQIGESPPAR